MGKWRKFEVGGYRLQRFGAQAAAVWRDADKVRRRVRLGVVATEAEARAALARFARDQNAQSTGLTLAEIYDAYTRDRELDGKQVPAFRHNWTALGPTFGHLTTADVNADLCRDYAKSRLAAGRSQGTCWSELTRLRSALNWAHKRGVIERLPYVWVPQKPGPRDRVMTVDELERLLAACVMPHVRLFVLLGIGTAARTEALLELTWDRVDLERGIIDLRRPEPVNPLQKAAKKQRAVVAIDGALRAALSEAKAGALSDHVIEWNGTAVDSIATGFNAARRRSGIKGISPHTLRHTAASWAFADGQELERVSRFLGHRDVETTRRIYVHTDAQYVAPVAEAVALRLVKGSKKP